MFVCSRVHILYWGLEVYVLFGILKDLGVIWHLLNRLHLFLSLLAPLQIHCHFLQYFLISLVHIPKYPVCGIFLKQYELVVAACHISSVEIEFTEQPSHFDIVRLKLLVLNV